ncbi:MAG: antibiotic biosynthesis monooxygenase [Deltaproteobacteria bacterium]|nr:antibiotic biosynthesis monooxygenase [Deltaproteobacteria bacterium]
MVVTIFRSRLREDANPLYGEWAARIDALARTMPGFVSVKRFDAADGERVTLVEFADQASHDAWRDHPEHRAAQRIGRERFYSAYRVQVCTLQRQSSFPVG